MEVGSAAEAAADADMEEAAGAKEPSYGPVMEPLLRQCSGVVVS